MNLAENEMQNNFFFIFQIKSHHLSAAIDQAVKSLDPDNLKVILENYEPPIDMQTCYDHTPFHFTIQNLNNRLVNQNQVRAKTSL
jgi:hypothetical protein